MKDSLLIKQYIISYSNIVHYFNNPNNEITLTLYRTSFYRMETIEYEDGSHTEQVVLNHYEDFIDSFPKDLLLTCQSLTEATQKLESSKSK